MKNTLLSQTIINMTENAINSIGRIGVPVQVHSSELSFSVNPKVDLSKVDLSDLNIKQINITDTEIGITLDQKIDENFKVNFSIDSKLKDFTKSISENETKLSFNIAGTKINENIDLSFGMSQSLCSLISPSGTNDFELDLSMRVKLR